MKKTIFSIASVAALAVIVSLTSCKKEDTTAPTLTVDGHTTDYTIDQSLPSSQNGGSWTNPTATATDDQDGEISTQVNVTGTVDPNTKGTYTLTYSVSDAAGNSATVIVTVNINNDCELVMNGNYSVHDTVPTLAAFLYNQTVAADNYVNNKIHFTHTDGFAFYQNNVNIYATVTGTSNGSTVTLPFQVANSIGSPAENHDFTGNGTVLQQTPFKFNITYSDHNITLSSTANGCVQTYTHQ